jgi:hypothetical protein
MLSNPRARIPGSPLSIVLGDIQATMKGSRVAHYLITTRDLGHTTLASFEQPIALVLDRILENATPLRFSLAEDLRAAGR